MEVTPGYKQIEIGVIPEDWLICPITRLLEKGTRITYGVVQPGSNDANGVLFIRGGDIVGGRVQTAQLRRIPNAVANQYGRTKLRGGEIVITVSQVTRGFHPGRWWVVCSGSCLTSRRPRS